MAIPEHMGTAEFEARCQLAREDTPRGFLNYFWCKHGKELPWHAFFGFIIPAYWAHGELTREELDNFFTWKEAKPFLYIYNRIRNVKVPKRGLVVRAAREFAKTVVLTVALNEFRIGHHPEKMFLILQLSESSAKDNSGKIAEAILKSPVWSKVFPTVRPDASWGAGGYFVVDTSIPAEEWIKKCSMRDSPTLIGLGYGSREIIGKHPDGGGGSDDMHDYINTASDKELRNTVNKIVSDFVYAPTGEAWEVNVGTPWVENDFLDFLAKSGEFVVVDIPAYMEKNESGEWVMPEHEWIEGGDYLYLWPELRGSDWVRLKKATSTPAEFARMVQLNLHSSALKTLRYQNFPEKDVRWHEWPGVVGVDPVATVRAVTGREGGSSHFAAAFALKTPYNNVCIADGILEKCDADEGERLLAQAFKTHPLFMRASIEIDGGGILFAAMQKRLGLSINPHGTAEIRKILKGKGTTKIDRQYEFLQPLLANGVVTISDGDTPFLNTARKWADRFPNFSSDSPELDVGDAILMAVYDIPEIWVNLVTNLDTERGTNNIWAVPKRKPSAWASIGDISVR